MLNWSPPHGDLLAEGLAGPHAQALATHAPQSLSDTDAAAAVAPLVALLRTGGLPQRGAAATALMVRRGCWRSWVTYLFKLPGPGREYFREFVVGSAVFPMAGV